MSRPDGVEARARPRSVAPWICRPPGLWPSNARANAWHRAVSFGESPRRWHSPGPAEEPFDSGRGVRPRPSPSAHAPRNVCAIGSPSDEKWTGKRRSRCSTDRLPPTGKCAPAGRSAGGWFWPAAKIPVLCAVRSSSSERSLFPTCPKQYHDGAVLSRYYWDTTLGHHSIQITVDLYGHLVPG